jgi:Flp pilus assembly pilin Flp
VPRTKGDELIFIEKLNHRFDEASEEGQALVEYALIIGSIAIVVIGALALIGSHVRTLLDLAVSRFPDVP